MVAQAAVTLHNSRCVPEPTPPFVLTFDLGTTLFKVCVFDANGRLLAVKRMPAGVGEGNWSSSASVVLTLLRDSANYIHETLGDKAWSEIRSISFATQANTFALHDARGDELTPLIFWPDPSAAGEEAAIANALPAEDFRRITGLLRHSPLMTIARLRWLQRAMPGVLSRTAQLRFICDEGIYALTGQHVTEAGVAALSGMFDLDRFEWWARGVEAAGIPSCILPRVVRAGTKLGRLLPDAADALYLSRECELVVGCLDQYAGAIGTGATEPGDICETTGTVLAAVRATDKRSYSPDIFEGPGISPERYWQMSFSSTSANLLEWYRSTLPERPDFSALSDEAEHAESAAPIAAFEEGKPISHCFRNITPSHTRGQIVRGIMERVAWQLKSQIDQLCGDDRPRVIRSAGGGAKSRFWLDLKSKVIGIPCVATDCDEPTSRGAAKLAMMSNNI